jgi:hypothetical protein
MIIEYLAHSSFLITCGNTKLIFDPWLVGSTYDNGWHLWPLPSKKPEDIEAHAILISHGHEDHLNPATLKRLDNSARVFFPFQWRGGIKPFLNRFGFEKITEAVNFRTYFVNDVEITYVSFSLESVIVLKHNEKVLVNINDALNSNHENAANFLMREIKKRWPKIDYLLSGWSGAGYFPNQVRYAGKNDKEVALLREQYFANNFCRYTNYFRPSFAMPIAPGFVLLKEENKWINHVKFPRTEVGEYYRSNFPDTSNSQIIVMQPGDVLEEGLHKRESHLHSIPEKDHYDAAYLHYKSEAEEINKENFLSGEEIKSVLNLLDKWINYNKQIYHEKVLGDAVFSLCLEDFKEDPYVNVWYEGGRFRVERSGKPLENKKVQIKTWGSKLIKCFKKEWGGDIITSGYALTVEVYEELSLEKNMDIVCVRLITRYPLARKDLRRFPMRALKFYISSPKSTSLWLKQKIMLKPYVNKFPFNERDHWITYNKCDLCAVCKMPVINLQSSA